jgi:DMSO reductase family type II enzyme heme b subunit
VPVKVVAAFDPYYHYVAFNRIAGVLSEEAGKVFRFKDQEKLHEEIIDSGLAKIYEGHLQVAESIAAGHGMAIETRLLDRKPHDAIERYLREVNPSLLVIGKLGIHADSELDIGGNAENLLRNVDCAVLLSQRQHRPAVDQVAEVTTSWTNEAEQRMQNVPSFVRDMARMAILRYAQERGHTVITERIVEEATASLMPGHAEAAMGEIVAAEAAGELGRRRGDDALGWSDDARALLQSVDDPALRGNLAMRAEKKARVSGSAIVERAHLASFVSHSTDHRDRESALHWQAALDKGGTSVDETAEKISDADIAEDSVAIQLPVKLPEGTEKPYFAMGDAAHPVNVWQWKSGTTDAPQSITLLNGRGIEDVETRDAAQAGIRAQGTYERGTWRVVVKRGLSAGDPEQDIQFVECAFIPVAFAAWDGSNSESGSRHALTTWYWLLLKPAPGNTPLLAAVAAFVLILLAEIGWARSASRKPEKVRGP